ncbi:MAG: EAL domain-containing protein [Nevskiaceae bacterium]|jgi:diguanylate cyclase (GGDEF)-like protein/PAS domain S-box-containing protein|nr:EAL domain-containing protein [Nevskiaceae bacterium]
MSSLKTKYTLYGAAIALLFGGAAALLLLLYLTPATGTARGPLFWILTSSLVLITLTSAWLAVLHGRRLATTLHQLNDSATRMAHGDYTQPVTTRSRHDELGELQRTVDQMRISLRQTTITKNHLDSVLNSMHDAVFVTDNDGTIRITNIAARRLTGYSGEQLAGRQIASLLHAPELKPSERLKKAQETSESVMHTQSGQTIPISFSESDIEAPDPQFVGHIYVARDITDRKRAERRIRYLARYDALTKIPNRMQFQHLLQQAIARALRAGTGLALLYLDMDRFKEINDTFGHSTGDRVLEVLTERLTRALPSETVLGRLAGDEFALFLDGITGEGAQAAVKHLSNDILEVIAQPLHVNQQEIFLSASIGVAFCPRDAENVIDLIRNADAAMYYSKQNGGNSCTFYSPEMNAASIERLMLKSKLKRAIERDELAMAYMPKVDAHTGHIDGAEALLRWRLPGHGDIAPATFIQLAEESNLIANVGEWVLDRVCLDYRKFEADGHSPGRIALNLSLKQLRQVSFPLNCREVFRRHQVLPECVELEITETTLMADPKRTIALLRELRAMGLHLAIDDFGTGYSSLSALQQFPINTLKIDQSFVRNVVSDRNDATLVRTIIDMGHSLGMHVVAEGVETAEQLEFLNQAGCDSVQGRLFGDPCSAQAFGALLARQAAGDAPFAALMPRTAEAASRLQA